MKLRNALCIALLACAGTAVAQTPNAKLQGVSGTGAQPEQVVQFQGPLAVMRPTHINGVEFNPGPAPRTNPVNVYDNVTATCYGTGNFFTSGTLPRYIGDDGSFTPGPGTQNPNQVVSVNEIEFGWFVPGNASVPAFTVEIRFFDTFTGASPAFAGEYTPVATGLRFDFAAIAPAAGARAFTSGPLPLTTAVDFTDADGFDDWFVSIRFYNQGTTTPVTQGLLAGLLQGNPSTCAGSSVGGFYMRDANNNGVLDAPAEAFTFGGAPPTLANAFLRLSAKLNINTGGCCIAGNCAADMSQADCENMGGVFSGVGVPCNAATCFCLSNPPPQNDDCTQAETLTINGPAVNGTNLCALSDAAPACFSGSDSAASGGVWYGLVGDGTTVTVTTCDTVNTMDTTIDVYTIGDCTVPTSYSCVAGNDDDVACGLQSSTTFCTNNGTIYFIRVAGFAGEQGNFSIMATSAGQSCTPCSTASCGGGEIQEDEACGSDANGGCNAATPVFQALTCNETVHGTTFAAANIRDTDWYLVTVPASGNVSATLIANFPAALFIVTDTDGNFATCEGAAVPFFANNTAICSPVSVNGTGLIPGQQVVIFVSTGTGAGGIFDGIPCGTAEYCLSVDIGVPCGGGGGACCCGSSCTNVANAGLCTAPGAFPVAFIAGGNCSPFSVTTPCCRANFNRSTIPPVISSQDIFDFLAAFFSTNAGVKACADFNGNPPSAANVTSQDIFDFLAAFFRPGGCNP